jgi:mannitol-1-/sugar-/sorbitol-6-phosphatase
VGSNLAGRCSPAMKRFECRAILFDLDGVLVDSTAYIEEQWRRWARSKGLSPEPFLRVCHGRRALETIRLAAPDLDAEAEVAAFVPEDSAAGPRFRALEGAHRLLQALPRGSWAVATSGTRAMATERLRGAGLTVPSVLVCAEDVTHGKPSPEVYLLAAAGLGASPAHCLVVEDAPAGVQSARAAGMSVLAVTTTHHRHELPADACTDSLANVHLGRIESHARDARYLELLVLDQ